MTNITFKKKIPKVKIDTTGLRRSHKHTRTETSINKSFQKKGGNKFLLPSQYTNIIPATLYNF